MKTIIAYTDGSAVVSGANKGRGGFGVYFPDFYGKKKGISIGYGNTKTGRMEQMALLYAIKSIKKIDEVELSIYSDSQYVLKAFTEKRLQKWANSSGNVKNRDLWEGILSELNKRSNLILDIRWIKSHQLEKEKDPIAKAKLIQNSHIIGNAMADRLANRWRSGDLKKTDKL